MLYRKSFSQSYDITHTHHLRNHHGKLGVYVTHYTFLPMATISRYLSYGMHIFSMCIP